MNECLIIMAKKPSPGVVKTRLARNIGKIPAAELYACFIDDLTERVRQLDIPIIISCDQQSSVGYFLNFDNSGILIQRGHDIGVRMFNSFAECFQKGFSKAILIGSDSPDIPLSYFKEAISALASFDLVIGSCSDAGYYLIGFKPETLCEDIFTDINWSTTKVWKETKAKISHNKLNSFTLPEWHDIDSVTGLHKYYSRNSRSMPYSETIQYLKKKEVLS